MKVHVWYGPSGSIVAVGSVVGDAAFEPSADEEGLEVLEVELDDDGYVDQLHETHSVDVAGKKLVQKG